MNFKLLFTITFSLLMMGISCAQRLSSFSVATLTEGNVMTVDGFDKLNEVLKRNNLYSLKPAYMSGGVALKFTGRRGRNGLELSYLGLTAFAFDSAATTNKSKVPFISGSNLRVIYFSKLFESNRWYADASLGLSIIGLNFKLVDTDFQRYDLDSLIANPNLSPSLDFSQGVPTLAVEIASGIYFKTKWFKKAFDDFDIGVKFGYVQPLIKGKLWRVNGTNNLLPRDIPTIRLNNVYFQISFLFKYNLGIIKKD